MLEVRDVTTGYGKVDVVKDVSFSVKRNENVCIIGPNGCGKSTLLKAIANILPFRGTIEFDNQPIGNLKSSEVSKRIAIMAQTSTIYFPYSVYETVMMGRYLHMKEGLFKTPAAKDKEKVMECLEAVGLVDVKDSSITQLSGGQVQRVFLARALAQEPEMILLDEPTNHLDLKYQVDLIDYLLEWSQKENHSVVGVLHDFNLAMRLSDNLLLMKEGSIVAQGGAEEVMTSEILMEVYGLDVARYFRQALNYWNTKGPNL